MVRITENDAIEIRATVRGNCGKRHQSVEEWRACAACAVSGYGSGNMIDLENLIRQRQDELRGRPLTRWEAFRERLPYRDRVLDWIGLGCFIDAGACFTFVAWARLFGGVH